MGGTPIRRFWRTPGRRNKSCGNSRVRKRVIMTKQVESADHSRSAAAFARANRLIPGGVNSPARAFGAVGGHPLFIARGEGPYLFDLDGRRYVDFVGSWGPLIFGHAHPRVVAAIEAALPDGTNFGAPTEREGE